MSNKESVHESVLLEEILSSIEMETETSRAAEVVFDGTLGGAGHSIEILRRFPDVRLLACDRDEVAIARAKESLKQYEERTVLLQTNFADIENALTQLSEEERSRLIPDKTKEFLFDRMILDLGLSSDQLDDPSRGFSFRIESDLDMRMDQSESTTAFEIVNNARTSELVNVFRRGGVGALSVPLASEIVKHRPIRGSGDLASICEAVAQRGQKKRKKTGGKRSHPATVPFQALRIEVNREFESLKSFLESVPNLLAPGGVLAIISFHSLEDKYVARQMREWSRLEPEQYRMPIPTQKEFGKLLTKKAIVPSAEECERNPRARSARLRIFVRGEEQYAQ
jgi:16S rRNA (cytosine1402-N4)-methyltransferase